MKTKIIAEIGVNHNGDIKLAKELIDVAKECGADIAKFQTFKPDKLTTTYASKTNYQNKNTKYQNQLEMLNDLELSNEKFLELKSYCDLKQIEFLSTGFDSESIEFLNKLNMKRWKIPSGEITNLPYLRKIASFSQPIILSSGMSYLSDIERALKILEENGTKREMITILHCSSEYPASIKNVNLKAMQTIEKAFNVSVGYSDHTKGILVPVTAIALGAKVIEKHLTLSNNLPGPDHKASAEPNVFKNMVESIRQIELALGNGIKNPTKEEIENSKLVRKSLVALRDIKIGDYFSEDNIGCKRPGTGITPFLFDEFIGKKSKKSYKKDELINFQ